jgi:hypothetical protein
VVVDCLADEALVLALEPVCLDLEKRQGLGVEFEIAPSRSTSRHSARITAARRWYGTGVLDEGWRGCAQSAECSNRPDRLLVGVEVVHPGGL